MAFAGMRGTGDWGTDERPKNFREMILWMNPNGMAPLTAILAKAAKESVDDPEFAWWEETLKGKRAQVNFTTGFSTTDNTITIAAESATTTGGLNFVAGDVLQVEKTEDTTYTNEFVTVSSVTSDTVIVIKRGAANTTAAPLATSVWLTKVGTAFEEGAAPPDVSHRNPTKVFNYTQIFKTALQITRTAKQTYARTGNAWENDKKRKSFDHSEALEMAFLFGKKYEDTGGSEIKRYTGGLRQFITTNNKVYTTTPTEDSFIDFITPVFNYSASGMSSDERLLLCGNGFLSSLNKLVRNQSRTQINYDGVIKVYGMNLQKWVLPMGTLGIKTHPLMNNHGRYNYSAFVLNANALKYRYIQDTKFEDNIQLPGYDQRKAQWITECGLEVHHEQMLGYITNFVV